MLRKKHPNKDIEAAVKYAETRGWRYKKAGKSSHPWGRLLCPLSTRDGCTAMSIWSTPRNPHDHAKLIKKGINRCPHKI